MTGEYLELYNTGTICIIILIYVNSMYQVLGLKMIWSNTWQLTHKLCLLFSLYWNLCIFSARPFFPAVAWVFVKLEILHYKKAALSLVDKSYLYLFVSDLFSFNMCPSNSRINNSSTRQTCERVSRDASAARVAYLKPAVERRTNVNRMRTK